MGAKVGFRIVGLILGTRVGLMGLAVGTGVGFRVMGLKVGVGVLSTSHRRKSSKSSR